MGKNALAPLTLKQTLLANPGKEDIPSSWRCVNSLTPDDPLMLSDVGHHWFRQWLVAYQVTSHCLNQWWFPGQVNAKFSTSVELIQLKSFHSRKCIFQLSSPFSSHVLATLGELLSLLHLHTKTCTLCARTKPIVTVASQYHKCKCP